MTNAELTNELNACRGDCSNLQSTLAATQAQRDAMIRQAVLADVHDGVLAEYSQEVIKIRRNVPWQITEQVTAPGEEGGDPVTEVRDRAMGDRPARMSLLPFPEALTPAAFEDRADRLCCMRQLSEVTGICHTECTSLLDSVTGSAQ